MFLKNDQVKDWEELQTLVARLFLEMGYEAESPYTVELAGRGKKQVDVWIRDPLASVNQIYLVECKLWDSRVPQETVHAFKTVMEGAGANTGFIISKVGFQSGAYEAIRYTNIHLLTFEDLQHKYGEEWLRKQTARLAPLLQQLREAYHLHFDQDNKLPIYNNIFFHTTPLYDELCRLFVLCGNLILLATHGVPKSYLGPEPIEAIHHPLDPDVTWTSCGNRPPYVFPTVREFFLTMENALRSWIQSFDVLRNTAHRSFDALPEGEQTKFMEAAMRAFTEETPVRVLSRYLSQQEYEQLLEKMGAGLAKMITQTTSPQQETGD